jgi:hypothetical protein
MIAVSKLQAAAGRVKCAQYAAASVVVSTAFVLALGNGRGDFASGADGATYFALQIVFRCIEIVYVGCVAVFLA